MQHHNLKLFTKYFQPVVDGDKRSEVRTDQLCGQLRVQARIREPIPKRCGLSIRCGLPGIFEGTGMTINWVKCAEQMPPVDETEIIIRRVNSTWKNGTEVYQTPADQLWMEVSEENIQDWEWIPLTAESIEYLKEQA